MNRSQNLPELLEQAQAAYHGIADPPGLRRGDAPLTALLPRLLDDALSLTGADFGNVQLLNPVTGALRIVTQSGFGDRFIDHFAVVQDDNSACGRAATKRAQIVIPDVDEDLGFTPHREVAAAAGFRAVQSTPLVAPSGRLVGMISTHFRYAHRPQELDLRRMERHAGSAGRAIASRLGVSGPAAGSPADDLIAGLSKKLFAAGLSVASARSILRGGPADDRLVTAIEEIDDVIRDLHLIMLDRLAANEQAL
ncbi:GAF domain-containing protein [Lentzea alba]|uniref:GAF domain-containing protein n=1 Tax=Lentzea alba TaxID=2714351 RepID=UPI0039BF648F